MNRRSNRPASGLAASVVRFLRRFRREEGAAVAIWFAVLALPLAVLSFALIDVNRASVEKRHLQDALDAATLLAARSTAKDTAGVQPIGAAALTAQLSGMSAATVTSSVFRVDGSKITGAATAKVTPVIANLWLGGDMIVHANSEVTRASTNLEVALVLDVTGSMSGTAIADLRTAATDLVNLVVQDVQSPYYSKAALVPYSSAVNLGTYAAAARGTPVGPKTITGAAWDDGVARTITAATKANPVVITSNNHGLQNNDVIRITNVVGMTQLNNKTFVVAGRSANTFQLKGVNGSSYSTYTRNGTIKKCLISDCSVVITSSSHGFLTGDNAYITGVGGMTGLNAKNFTVANLSASTFSLSGTVGWDQSAYTSGGAAQCTKYGCQFMDFTNASDDDLRWQPTTCVTERTGANRYTDVSPASSPVGFNYQKSGTSNACPTATIIPLTSTKKTLTDEIAKFTAVGSTAGQIGVGWGWYMVSPNFASLWPTESKPAAYGAKDLLKVVVIMTDGDFNTPYCNGVIARNAGSGSGSSDEKINCDASAGNQGTYFTNNDAFSQAQAMCDAMKLQGVIVYTVGFNINAGSSAETVVKKCATSEDKHVYLPSGGGALKDAFAAIGREIMKLRLSK